MWRSDKSPEAEGRLENIKELYNVLDEFETINDFIEYAALVTDADENTTEDQLVVMTLHASKGLEFDCVFLTGWEEGLFPHQEAMDESGEEGLEEERRLAYVGITRAREKAFISFATNRRIYGQWENALPSRFIDELPADHIQNETTVSMGYGNQGFSHTKVNPYRYEESPFAAPTHQSVDPYWNSNLPHHQASKSRRVGKRVYHESFGYGTVIKETPNGLEVHFDDFGLKKVQARFLSEA